jgi:arabinogalactan oligomer/maltooligosaccharide transport system substrate-binding protein
MPSRRRVLQGCGVALSTALAGCAPSGPHSRATLAVAVERSFEATAPFEVAATVDVEVHSAASSDAGVQGLALVALDEDREPLASTSLPDVTYDSASPGERTVQSPTGDRDEAVYTVATTRNGTLATERLPVWLSVRADRVWAGGEGTPAPADNRVPLAAPPPPVEVVSQQYRGGFPPPDTVEPGDYEADTWRTEFGVLDDGALVAPRTDTPEAATAPLWYGHVGWKAKPLAAAADAFAETARHSVSLEPKDRLTERLDEASDEERPPLVSTYHRSVQDVADHLVAFDVSETLALTLTDRFLAPTSAAVDHEGDTVGIPWAADTAALLYNRELVAEPPATTAELRSVAADHHAPDADRFGLGHLLYPSVLSGWVHAFGGYYYDSDADELGLTERATVRGLRFVLEELLPLAPVDHEGAAQVEAFRTGRAPFLVGGAATARLASDEGVDVGAVPLPPVEGTRPTPHVGVTALLFTDRVNYRRDPASEAAHAFAEYYATSDQVLSGGVEATGVVPTTRAVAEREETTDTTDGFLAAVEGGRLPPSTARYDPVPGELYVALKDVMAGEADLEPALSDAEASIRDHW